MPHIRSTERRRFISVRLAAVRHWRPDSDKSASALMNQENVTLHDERNRLSHPSIDGHNLARG